MCNLGILLTSPQENRLLSCDQLGRWGKLIDISTEIQARAALFEHLSDLLLLSPDGNLTSSQIKSFEFSGKKITVQQQRGINKPQGFEGALTITTIFTPYGQEPPYADYEGEDGYHRYKYEGKDPSTYTNKSLRFCMEHNLPLVYFVGVRQGVYNPIYPTYIIGEDVERHEFIIAFNPLEVGKSRESLTPPEKKYILQETRRRVHQPIFRERVLHAYADACTICNFRHRELLDAAHIIEDSKPHGEPIVENGLALCKMHHAAYDKKYLSIRPDYKVVVSEKIMVEIDGPMLKHGLQEMNGRTITLPRQKSSHPDPQRLQERHEEFLLAN